MIEIPQPVRKYLRNISEPDRVYPKNKKVEVVFLIKTTNAILLRTEGPEDITLVKLPGTEYEVPMVLPEKLQAVARRRMISHLRRFRDERTSSLRRYLITLSQLYKYTKKRKQEEVIVGFAKAKKYADKPEAWNCYIQPPGTQVRDSTDVGMDGFCPACALFGTVIDSAKMLGIYNESVGVKSRVEFDPAFAITDQEKCVAMITHNKVADGVSWTGQSLFTEYHVLPGTVLVGKVTLEDVTLPELMGFLATLATIDRLGGRERIFGGVRIHLIGIRGGSYETISALELARMLAKEYGPAKILPDAEEVEEKVWRIIENLGFHRLSSSDARVMADNMGVWDELWKSTVEYDRQVVEKVLSLIMNEYTAVNQ